jgi:hypothetical protein
MLRVLLVTLNVVLTLLSSVAAEGVCIVPTSSDTDPMVTCESVSNGDRTESSYGCFFDSCDCESEESNALVSSASIIPIPEATTASERVTSDFPPTLPHSIFHPPHFS